MARSQHAGHSADSMYRSLRVDEGFQRRRRLPRILPIVCVLCVATYLASSVLLARIHVRGASLVALAAPLVLAGFIAFQMLRARSAHSSWNKGAWGERRIAFRLRNLKGSSVHHDLAIAGSSANVDHVVINRGGVFVIDTKQRGGQIVLEKRRVVAHYGKKEFEVPLETTKWEAQRVSSQLGFPTMPVLCLTGGKMNRRYREVDGVVVISDKSLKSWLRKQSRRKVLSQEQLEQLQFQASRGFVAR